jgi:hypothetical protein
MSVRHGLSWAGLASGPLAWAISTQFNYVLPSWQCGHRVYPVPWIALALAVVAAGGAWQSLAAYRRVAATPVGLPRRPRSERLLSLIGTAAGALFALGILLQGFAGLVFVGCER